MTSGAIIAAGPGGAVYVAPQNAGSPSVGADAGGSGTAAERANAGQLDAVRGQGRRR
jgi:hypothetical protein